MPTKSKELLIEALNRLLLTRPYADIHVPDIIGAADVSRSTFYEHFKNKDAILAVSLQPILHFLAEAGFNDQGRAGLRFVFEHIQEHAKFGKILLSGQAGKVAVQVLAGQIQERLGALAGDKHGNRSLTELLALQMAEGHLGLIKAWLERNCEVPFDTMADQLHVVAVGMIRSLVPGHA